MIFIGSNKPATFACRVKGADKASDKETPLRRKKLKRDERTGLGGGVTSWLAELQHSCRAAAQTEASRLSLQGCSSD